jgi:hypothetical protein
LLQRSAFFSNLGSISYIDCIILDSRRLNSLSHFSSPPVRDSSIINIFLKYLHRSLTLGHEVVFARSIDFDRKTCVCNMHINTTICVLYDVQLARIACHREIARKG